MTDSAVTTRPTVAEAVSEVVAQVVDRARDAQQIVNDWTAEQVQELTTAVAYAVARDAKPAAHIAGRAGFAVPGGTTFLIVEEDAVGPDAPFSGEKLSVVLALCRYSGGIDQAVALVNAITGYQGLGHTCGIHTSSDDAVAALANGTRTARVLVNQNLNEGAGSPRNGLPFTLGRGTWAAPSPPRTSTRGTS